MRMEWQPIETAPKDGRWFVIARAGEEGYEVGKYDPTYGSTFVHVGDDMYQKVKDAEPYSEWRGFNNFHRATHWAPIEPPIAQGRE